MSKDDEEYARKLQMMMVEKEREKRREREYQEKMKQMELGSSKKKYFPQIEAILDTNSLVDADLDTLIEFFFFKPIISKVYIPYIVVQELDDMEKRSKMDDHSKFLHCKSVNFIIEKACESQKSNLEIGKSCQLILGKNRNDDMIYEDCKEFLSKKNIDVRDPHVFVFLISNDRNMRVKFASLKPMGLRVDNRVDTFLNHTVKGLVREFSEKNM